MFKWFCRFVLAKNTFKNRNLETFGKASLNFIKISLEPVMEKKCKIRLLDQFELTQDEIQFLDGL